MNRINRMGADGLRRPGMPLWTRRLLEERLGRIEACPACGEESLRRLRQEAGHIRACLQQLRDGDMRRLSGRMLKLARKLTADGRARLTLEAIQAGAGSFDAAHMLTMREIGRAHV